MADHGRADADPGGLTITVRLQGETVVWSGLMFPDREHGVIEEARFHLAQYLGEIERVHGAWQ
ncbi:hypothetical protein [Streptomyces sp. LN245]|uniref:hypothetical protein n=1 Tax=Streptomyces sp. LN245 TaxID=3112975 RepID=UPI00371EA27D